MDMGGVKSRSKEISKGDIAVGYNIVKEILQKAYTKIERTSQGSHMRRRLHRTR